MRRRVGGAAYSRGRGAYGGLPAPVTVGRVPSSSPPPAGTRPLAGGAAGSAARVPQGFPEAYGPDH